MSQSQGAVLTESQRGLLRAALNRVVPANRDLPGAGDLGVGEAVERTAAATPTLRRALLDGLSRIDVAAWQQSDHTFPELDPADQDAALRAVEAADPAGFDLLVRLAYRAYYTDPRVVAALGLPSAPQPRGYQLPRFDPALLDKVRQRGPIWRKTG